ncbi:MAG: SPOR domain-containing protein [Deltaproteobacteria bacterium]|nr:SPOR domain-containing protein [Deltaproteobacteria bacterium]
MIEIDSRSEHEVIDDLPEEDEAQFFCRFTFGQFFTLTMLMVMTICASFYLGARYGNQYLRLDGIPDRETATSAALRASPSRDERAEMPLTEPQREALEDKKLKAMARQALWREEQKTLEHELSDYLTSPVAVPPPPRVELGAVSDMENTPVLAPPVPTQVPLTPPLPGRTATVTLGGGEAPPPSAGSLPSTGSEAMGVPDVPAAVQGMGGAPYAVQVGAYRNYDEANARLAEWHAKGYTVYMTSADLPDSGRWYRLRVGGYATRAEAQSARDQLASGEAVEGIVVQNP